MVFNCQRFSITCCKDCPDRYPGCHGKCEKYIQQRAEYDAKKEADRKKYDIAVSLTQQRCDVIHKVTKKQRYKSKFR